MLPPWLQPLLPPAALPTAPQFAFPALFPPVCFLLDYLASNSHSSPQPHCPPQARSQR